MSSQLIYNFEWNEPSFRLADVPEDLRNSLRRITASENGLVFWLNQGVMRNLPCSLLAEVFAAYDDWDSIPDTYKGTIRVPDFVGRVYWSNARPIALRDSIDFT